MINITDFFKELLKLEKSERIDFIYDTIDDLVIAQDLDSIDEILKNINLEQIRVADVISFLTICHATKTKRLLREYDKFYKKVIDYSFNVLKKTPEDIKALFGGLETEKDPGFTLF